MKREPAWAKLSDDELLKLRFRDLKLSPESATFYPQILEVMKELHANSLIFQPLIYIGDEWFSPDGVCAVAIPFFLCHPRLIALEKKMILECEGEHPDEFARFLRHELGHAFDHAYRISRRKDWPVVFGSRKKKYDPDTYRPRPYSKNFVSNINRWYAQAHPDEDFAETFAVWLDPNSNWKARYRDWGALKKLTYIENICREYSNKQKAPPKGRMISDVTNLSGTLGRYYQLKRKRFAEDYPDFYDKDLLRIFARPEDWPSGSKYEKAFKFMRKHRREIIGTIAHWTKERRVVIDDLVQELTGRTKDLQLVLKRSERETLIETTAFLATLVSNYLFTGHFKRTI